MVGLGVMIQTLGGNEETVSTIKNSLGKTIQSVELVENELIFKFTDNTGIKIFDDGQSCCEVRYMATSDDLTEYKNTVLLDFELKEAPEEEDEYGAHEIQFLDVKTSNGIFQMANHNEHNGYYGGFWIVAKSITD